jgi:lycopene beta-cyclase
MPPRATPRPDLPLGPALDRYHYLFVLLACLAVTLPLEVVLGARVYRQPRRLVLTLLVAMTPFVVWDLVGIARGHWRFADRFTLGLELPGGMPVEELAFFVVVPICTLLTHQAVRRLGARLWPDGRIAAERGDA